MKPAWELEAEISKLCRQSTVIMTGYRSIFYTFVTAIKWTTKSQQGWYREFNLVPGIGTGFF